MTIELVPDYEKYVDMVASVLGFSINQLNKQKIEDLKIVIEDIKSLGYEMGFQEGLARGSERAYTRGFNKGYQEAVETFDND